APATGRRGTLIEDADRPRAYMLDFASPKREPTIRWNYAATRNAVTVARCILPPNPGVLLGASQLVLAVHMGEPFVMEYRLPGEDRLQSHLIEPGMMNVNPGNRPFFQAWENSPDILVIALDSRFAERVAVAAFERDCINDMPSIIGAKDNAALCFARLLDTEMAFERRGGTVISEAISAALTVHLVRRFCPETRPPLHGSGGLTPRQLRHVLDRIEDEIDGNLTTRALAFGTGLSGGHFMRAFKTSTGKTLHAYVIEQRIRRAQMLLADPDMPLAQIAYATGFSSQSHMNRHFGRLVGMTPGQFRRVIL
ncbi:helix-turn-helix domain-containing protein, partial [Sphingobium cloacae]